MNDNHIEHRTETIGVRFSKTEKQIIEDFIEGYYIKNKKKEVNKTDFIRTAIFTHIYHLKHSDSIFDTEYFKKSIVKIRSHLKGVKNVINDMEEELSNLTTEMTESLIKQLELSY
jgi:hypothetical protein